MKHVPQLSLLAGALLVLAHGCSEGPAAMTETRIMNAERNTSAVILDTSLMPGWFEKMLGNGKLSFEVPASRQIANGSSLEVYSEIRNRTQKDILLEISTAFRNSNQQVVDETRWEKFKLTPNSTITYKTNSLLPASRFCVRVRNPRRSTNYLGGQGVNLMADKMLRSLFRAPAIFRAQKNYRIALHQFENNTNNKLNESIFTSKLRAEINSRAPGKLTFVSRRMDVSDAIAEERRRKREGEYTSNKAMTKEKLSGADYFLTGKLHSLGGKNYYLFTYQLIDTENSDIVWEDQFEIGDY